MNSNTKVCRPNYSRRIKSVIHVLDVREKFYLLNLINRSVGVLRLMNVIRILIRKHPGKKKKKVIC